MRLLLAGLLLCGALTGARAADPADLWSALEAADDLAMASYVESHYRDAGASLDDTLTWQFAPFDQIVNYFSDSNQIVVLAAMPEPHEVDAYWLNWSKALTESRWQPSAFFADAGEARRLARYNQFVLAAHEYGHALTYRYDPGHLARHDDEVNCREFYADRLAASLIREVSRQNADFGLLEARYVALMASMNAEVAPGQRYAIASLTALETDCERFHVEQPDAEHMAPYASAFFERQRLLLASDPPPLATVYETHLFPRLAERQYPPANLAGPVQSVGTLSELVALPANGPYPRPMLSPEGLYILQLDDKGVPLAYGLGTGSLEELPPIPTNIGIFDAVTLGPDRFVALGVDEDTAERELRLVDFRRGTSGWSSTVVSPVREISYITNLSVDPHGGLHLFTFTVDFVTGPGAGDVHSVLDPETLAVVSSTRLQLDSHPVAVGAEGEIYSFVDGTILVTTPAGKRLTFAGHGLVGLKDGDDPHAAEFYNVEAALATVDGGLIVVDRHPRTGERLIRGIAPAAP